MKEQSQIEAMRAAVRGDLERARQRRAGPEPQPEPEPEPEPQEEPEPQRPGMFASFFRRRD